jgi:hypothetical protein
MARLLFMPTVFTIKDGKTKLNFRIMAEEYDAISEWIGKPALLKMTLKQRLG